MPFVGELSALLTAALWSCGALVFTAATKRIGPTQVNISRLIVAAVLLIIVVTLFGFETHLTSFQLLNLSISGVLGLSLGDSFLFRAFHEIGARITMLIMSLAPAVAALCAFLVLGEDLSVIGMIGMAVTILGICIVIFEQNADGSSIVRFTGTGVVLAFLAAVGQGTGLVFAKMAFREGEIHGFVAAAARIVASLIVLIPATIVSGRFKNPVRIFSADSKALELVILGAVLGPFLGISFSLIAIKHANVGIAATIMALVPIIMLPLIRYIYKEKLSWKAIAGAFVAVGGVALLFLTAG